MLAKRYLEINNITTARSRGGRWSAVLKEFPLIEIRLLGTYEVRHDGTVVEIPSRPAKLLLAYLALSAGKSHPREQVAGIQWPYSDEKSARGNLRQTLWRLRQAIGGDCLLADSKTISLASGPECWLDTVLLEEPSPDDLPAAVAVYQGELLPGFYEDWVLQERERLRATFERKIQLLLDDLVQAREWPEVLRWAEHWIGLGYVPEPAYRALMVAYAEQGNVSSMAAAYRRCVQALDEELAVEPSSETKGLYQHLMAAVQQGASPTTSGLQDTTGDPLDYRPSFIESDNKELVLPQRLFVGREPELESLRSQLEEILEGRGRVAFLSGEAGRGKTSLITEFSRLAQEVYPELIVAFGACSLFTGIGDPYLPFREILRMLTGDAEEHWAAGIITRDQGIRLWRLLPEAAKALVQYGPNLIGTFLSGERLAGRVSAATYGRTIWLDKLQDLVDRRSTLGDQKMDQDRVFEEYADVLQSLASERPLLLLLDDIHWADLSSISLLGHLGRRVMDSPILIVGAYRPEEVARGRKGHRHPLEDVLSELKRQYGDILISLDQVNQAQEKAFIDALLDSEPNLLGEHFRQELYQHTQGHALFTVELMRDLKERGELFLDDQGKWLQQKAVNWDKLPPKVEGVIERRIGRLDKGLKEFLDIASVEGESFTAEVIAQVQSVGKRELIHRLSGELDRRHHLIEAQVVRQLGSQRLYLYRFRHSLFQLYLYDSLDEVERSFLHEAVGNAIEHVYKERTQEVAMQLANHFTQAGLNGKAAKYLREAGDTASQLYAYDEAISNYNQIIELVDETELSGEDLTYLYTQIGRNLELKDLYEDALGIYREMERIARDRGDQAMILAAVMSQFTLRAIISPAHDPVEAEALYVQASELARELGDQAAEATILWNALNLYRHTNRLRQAVKFGERSLELARKLNYREQAAFTLNDIAHCYHGIGQFGQAKEVLQEAAEIWTELGNQPMLADCQSSLVWSQLYTGEYDEAMRSSNDAYSICKSIGNARGQAYSRLVIGYIYWDRGQPDQAMQSMRECIRLAKLANFTAPLFVTHSDLASVNAGLGDSERGLMLARMALEQAEIQFPVYRAYPLSVIAEIQLNLGLYGEAAVALEQARSNSIEEAYPIYAIHVLLAEGKLALGQREYQKAIVVTETLLDHVQEYRSRAFLPDALFLQGRIHARMGKIDFAVQLLQEARVAAEEIGSRRTLWRILFKLSQLEVDPETAFLLQREAQEVLHYISKRIGAPDLRKSFLAQPDVKAVLKSSK